MNELINEKLNSFCSVENELHQLKLFKNVLLKLK